MGDRPYLSIGEVLGMLLEEFPDVSISKIRFLESQGLIDPERTPSGYRKFYDADVDRLRVILREQRQNFLPLRVIRDRLQSGQIDDSGGFTPPRGLRNVVVLDGGFDETGELVVAAGTVVPTAHHPAAQVQARPSPSPLPPARPQPAVARAVEHAPANGHAQSPAATATASRDTYLANELCDLAGITGAQLADLRSYGIVVGTGSGANAWFSTSDVAVAKAAAGFLARGIEARHLRPWRQAAEREAALFEQMVLPLVRQRNPQSRHQAAVSLRELSSLGGELRAAILAAALRHHLDT